MNIKIFIEARKKKGLVQSELAADICTQATLSRFENNGQIPNMKILIKLCNRLDLPLSELFPKVGIRNAEITEKLNKAEFSLIISEYDQAVKMIEEIPIEKFNDPIIKIRYDYLKAFLMIYTNHAAKDIMEIFDRTLKVEAIDGIEIFRLLAYTGKGMVHKDSNDLYQAERYFGKVLNQIYDFPTKEIEDVWRVVHILFQCSKFYADIGEIDISNALANHVIGICSDNHVTYYLARGAIQLAKNAMTVNAPKEQILELIYDARAYSKINRNTVALEKLAKMEATLKIQEKD